MHPLHPLKRAKTTCPASPHRRRMRRLVSASALPECLADPAVALSDLEFLFAYDSDLDSLPDLTDASACSSPVATPTKFPHLQYFDFPQPAKWALTCPPASAALELFTTPELVYKIVEYAHHRNNVDPHEVRPTDRHPAPAPAPGDADPNVMFTCLQVNRLFYAAAKQVMGQRLCFAQEHRLGRFLRRKTPASLRTLKPRKLVLNRLFGANQAAMDALTQDVDFSALEWLEVFMCPRLLPSQTLFHPALKTLIVAGSRALDDSVLLQVARRCPNLEVLDLRACDAVTDFGVHAVGTACRSLRVVNLGRKKRGHLITDHSVAALAANNRHLHTVGLAGCHVSDRLVWLLAARGGDALHRLLLNNCPYVSNRSLPVILSLGLWPNLSVLEICGVTGLTHVGPVVAFKRRQHARGIYLLVETCAELARRMHRCESEMDSSVSKRIFQDLSEWANAADDDGCFLQLVRSRGAANGPMAGVSTHCITSVT